MTFEDWWPEKTVVDNQYSTPRSAARAGWDAAQAELRAAGMCGKHPVACNEIKGGDGTDNPVQTYWNECTACAREAEMQKEIDRWHDKFMLLASDMTDGFECLPSCDSVMHDDGCPLAFPEVAWRKLREEIDRLRSALEVDVCECKWCISNEPEWSMHAKVWIHRRESVDKACLNQAFSAWWDSTGKNAVGGSTEEQYFNAGRESLRAELLALARPASPTPKEIT